jgi:hypothetical protein
MPLRGSVRVTIAALLAAAAGMLAWAAPAAASAPTGDTAPCARAEALYKAGYYAEAEQQYKSLLGVAPCATTARATAARNAAARQAGMPLRPTEQLAQALRLQNAGFEEEARKIVKTVARNSTQPIPTKLRAVDQRIGWWRELLGLLGPILRLALEILAVIVGVAVAALLAITGLHALYLRTQPSAQLVGFTGSSETTLGPVLSAALSAALGRMSDEAPGRRIDWQSGTEPKFEIPASVSEAVPQAGLLAGLLQMLDGMLYRRLYLVSGTVHPMHEHRGAGLTLAVATRNGRTVDQVTIWERDFLLKKAAAGASDAVRYERLVLPAAVWLGYRRQLGFKPTKAPLHTLDWRSYALFALGELVPDPTAERRLYELALDRDCANLGARLNLGALLLQRPAYEVPPQSGGQLVADGSREGWEECLLAAEVHLGEVERLAKPEEDPVWYRARYMQAVSSIYRQDAPTATTIISQLRSEISRHRSKPQLRGLLDELAQAVAVLERTAELGEGRAVNPPGSPRGGWRSSTAEYNLACFWSRYARVAETDLERARRTIESVRLLRRAINRDRHIAAEAQVDPAFDPIRASAGFQALAQKTEVASPPAPAQRYAVTLDPGPELLELIAG